MHGQKLQTYANGGQCLAGNDSRRNQSRRLRQVGRSLSPALASVKTEKRARAQSVHSQLFVPSGLSVLYEYKRGGLEKNSGSVLP